MLEGVDSVAGDVIFQEGYRAGMLLLAYVVACLGAYAGLSVGERVRVATSVRRRWAWLAVGATIMGVGIWSMHFTAMLAMHLPFQITHDPSIVVVSLLPAILGSFYALHTLAERQFLHFRYILAGTLLGLGVGVMHYTGMASLRMPAQLYYDPWLFLFSAAAAIGLGIAAMYVSRLCYQLPFTRSSRIRSVPVAMVVILAVSGIHFVALSATYFISSETLPTYSGLTHEGWLIYAVSAGAILAALASLGAVLVDRRLQQSERERHMSRRQLMEVIGSMRDGVLVLDKKALVLMYNRAFIKLTGYTDEELATQPATRIEYALGARELNWHVQEYLLEHDSWQGEIQALHRSGKSFPARLTISRVDYSQHEPSHYVVTLSDISEQKAAQAKIHHLAYNDSLTDLPNRRSLHQRLQVCQQQSEKTASHVMLMLLDIDKFKALNDALGQAMGDRLLRCLAERLQRHVPQADDLARLDGNEFALILIGLPTDIEVATRLAKKRANMILNDISTTYDLGGQSYTCRVSAGVHVFRGQPTGVDELLKKASMALFQAKQAGDHVPCLFDPDMERRLDERIQLEADLRCAIDSDQLRLYLQPQVDDCGEVVGAEGLVRWRHPVRGLVSPAAFIPLAEETGLIVPLGQWVMDRASQLLAEWAQHPSLCKAHLSINVSVREFQQLDFVDTVLDALARHGAPATQLTLELTETLLLANVEDVIDKMSRLKAHGVSFALDDFGTGYSSLAYLKRLPLDVLKIDVAFVCDLPANANAVTIARTIIALAESLNLKVVAEGVETTAQHQVLEQLGCRHYQGYLFGRPQPAEALLQTFNEILHSQK